MALLMFFEQSFSSFWNAFCRFVSNCSHEADKVWVEFLNVLGRNNNRIHSDNDHVIVIWFRWTGTALSVFILLSSVSKNTVILCCLLLYVHFLSLCWSLISLRFEFSWNPKLLAFQLFISKCFIYSQFNCFWSIYYCLIVFKWLFFTLQTMTTEHTLTSMQIFVMNLKQKWQKLARFFMNILWFRWRSLIFKYIWYSSV